MGLLDSAHAKREVEPPVVLRCDPVKYDQGSQVTTLVFCHTVVACGVATLAYQNTRADEVLLLEGRSRKVRPQEEGGQRKQDVIR